MLMKDEHEIVGEKEGKLISFQKQLKTKFYIVYQSFSPTSVGSREYQPLLKRATGENNFQK